VIDFQIKKSKMRHIFTFLLTTFSVLLIAQQSNYRRILIFAPDSTNVSFKTQNRIFQKEDSACVQRDIIVEYYVFKSRSIVFFDKYQVSKSDFTLLLIGKDGFVKLRSKEVVKPERIYALVDAMPMRKDEMRKMKKQ
jgi:Domain of unknown function (DUF4174)